MATKLPKINSDQKAKIDPKKISLAVVDDDSLKKIVSADRKTFTKTIGDNTKKLTSPFQDFFTSYKVEFLDSFSKMQSTLGDILNVLVENNNSFKKFSKDYNVHETDKEKKKRLRDQAKELDDIENKREDEMGDGDDKDKKKKSIFERVKGGIGAGYGFASDVAQDPSVLTDTFKGALFGNAFGKIISSAIKNPLKSLGAAIGFGLKRFPTVAAAAAVGSEAYQSFAGDDYKGDDTNSGFANGLGRFLAGNGKDDGKSFLSHILGTAGMGALVGKGGGLWGMLAGGLIGAGAGVGSSYIGPKASSDWVQYAADKAKGFMQAFNVIELDIEELKKKADIANKEAADLQKSSQRNMDEFLQLQKDKEDAVKAGDKTKIETLDKKIDVVNAEGLKINSDLSAEQAKEKEYRSQIQVAKDEDKDRYKMTSPQLRAADVGKLAGSLVKPIEPKKIDGAMKLGELAGSLVQPENSNKKVINPDELGKIAGSVVAPSEPSVVDNLSKFFNKINIFSDDNWTKIVKMWQGKDYIDRSERFPGKAKDDRSFIMPTKKTNPLDNLYTETLKVKNLEISKMAKQTNENDKNAFGKMLSGMINNVNSSTVNNNVSNKTVINKPATTTNHNFTSYGRGE